MLAAGEGQGIPNKAHYRTGEVCELTDTQPYVLKFWEQEFPQLAPEKNRTGQRVYRRKDVELVRRIKYLLYEKDYTIAGVRRVLESGARDAENGDPEEPDSRLVSRQALDREGSGPSRASEQDGGQAAAEAGAEPESIPSQPAITTATDRAERFAGRRDVRQDLSGLLFEQVDASSPRAGTARDIESAVSPEALAAAEREALAAADREALATAEISRLLEERDRFASEAATLRSRLARARDELRELVDLLDARSRIGPAL